MNSRHREKYCSQGSVNRHLSSWTWAGTLSGVSDSMCGTAQSFPLSGTPHPSMPHLPSTGPGLPFTHTAAFQGQAYSFLGTAKEAPMIVFSSPLKFVSWGRIRSTAVINKTKNEAVCRVWWRLRFSFPLDRETSGGWSQGFPAFLPWDLLGNFKSLAPHLGGGQLGADDSLSRDGMGIVGRTLCETKYTVETGETGNWFVLWGC